ncbi:hypothetical protein [Magnetospirillum sp. SS-4]|uniref:hypothetical protein n=1 Tax=Magnetospirillum sp. SS-4 TaxID=2681465 RepID=UPI001573E58B|nr:hypothetical protein [Magnetospirillum sp. SS-4]
MLLSLNDFFNSLLMTGISAMDRSIENDDFNIEEYFCIFHGGGDYKVTVKFKDGSPVPVARVSASSESLAKFVSICSGPVNPENWISFDEWGFRVASFTVNFRRKTATIKLVDGNHRAQRASV